MSFDISVWKSFGNVWNNRIAMEKINFSGGEPFIHQKGIYLGELVRFCKEQLKLPGVSIVSNGSLITEKWFSDYGLCFCSFTILINEIKCLFLNLNEGEYLDILAINCDSFDQETNRLIGRGYGKKDHIKSLEKVRQWCNDYHVAFKLNTVVNTVNLMEDMNHNILTLNPIRWKVKVVMPNYFQQIFDPILRLRFFNVWSLMVRMQERMH